MPNKNEKIIKNIEEIKQEITDNHKELSNNMLTISTQMKEKAKKASIKESIKNYFRNEFPKFFFQSVFIVLALFLFQYKITEILNSPNRSMIYKTSNYSNIPDKLEQKFVATDKYPNQYLFSSEISFDLSYSQGKPDQAFLVYTDDDNSKMEASNFHKLNLEKKSIFSNKYSLNAKLFFYSKHPKITKKFYLVFIDKANSHNIDLLLMNLENNGKIIETEQGMRWKMNENNFVSIREFDKQVVLGNDILGYETPFNNPKLQFNKSEELSDIYDKNEYFKDKKVIEAYLKE